MRGGTGGEKMYTTSTPMPTHQLSDSNRRIMGSHNDNRARNLRIFCLGGRLVFGPDVRSLFLTILLIMVPVVLFSAFVSQRLVEDFQHQLGDYIVAICVILTAYVIILLFLTSARDPGIIPRNLHPPEDEGSSISADWPGSQVSGPSLPPTKDVLVNGMVVKTTYENFRYRYDGKMNPYNLGCVRNVLEVFFSKIPKSKNKFRAKVRVDSSGYAASMQLSHVLSPEMPKRSFDIEVGKRQAVADEDFEDIQSQIDSIGGLERCGTQPRHANWDHKANWEITPEIQVLAAEFGMEPGLADGQKISRDH
ncbi:hypothetical protein SADUNF_Sadunf01G0051200 [Salix dunnii]|uniref:Uncharacterized protein n=1 Tax=Salix dunnii TaxID=1413687 RepID=A0A835NA40_9ROSI|nr:hypothetical protein SADUNF_Sadunf01G0051200 [Salix dunnii]